MDSFAEHIEKLKSRKKKFQKHFLKVASDSAHTITALAISRVVNRRVDDEGSIFGIYSDSYQKTRIKKNLTGDQINFSHTNEMWRTTIPRLVVANDNRIEFIVKPDTANEDKMKWQNDRFGNIIAMSDEEKRIHDETLSETIHSLIID